MAQFARAPLREASPGRCAATPSALARAPVLAAGPGRRKRLIERPGRTLVRTARAARLGHRPRSGRARAAAGSRTGSLVRCCARRSAGMGFHDAPGDAQAEASALAGPRRAGGLTAECPHRRSAAAGPRESRRTSPDTLTMAIPDSQSPTTSTEWSDGVCRMALITNCAAPARPRRCPPIRAGRQAAEPRNSTPLARPRAPALARASPIRSSRPTRQRDSRSAPAWMRDSSKRSSIMRVSRSVSPRIWL